MKYRIKKRNIIGSIAFCVGWIITASIGLWAMAIYGAFFAIREMR